ncbi:MAG: hypothetical protein J6P21_03430 [Clostridia bacterium]|nr:hypothetical protein [Clostridia bacterium]
MSYRISKRNNKRVKSVLASLLVSSNFLNLVAQNAKCMDMNNVIISQQQSENKDVKCIDDKFILDMLQDYAYYKKNADYTQKKYDGYRFINLKFNNGWEYLKTKVFNKNLSHNFSSIGCVFSNKHEFCIEQFNSYAIVHTMKAFFEKHEPIRLAFYKLYNELCNESKNMKFLINYFSNCTSGGISGNSAFEPFKSIKLSVFWDDCKNNGNYVGFEKYSSWVQKRFMPNLIDSNKKYVTLAYELYNGLSLETRNKIENMINEGDLSTDEVYGTLYIIYNTLHELTHCTLYCLRHHRVHNSNIFHTSMKQGRYQCELENSFLENRFAKLFFNLKIDIDQFPGIANAAKQLQELRNNMNNRKNFDATDKDIAKFHGFTSRSTVDYHEFIAELGALGNMPTFHDFINPKNFVELLDFYAKFACFNMQ